jgi:hypothetical protein
VTGVQTCALPISASYGDIIFLNKIRIDFFKGVLVPADYYRVIVLPKHETAISLPRLFKNELLKRKVVVGIGITAFYVEHYAILYMFTVFFKWGTIMAIIILV